MPQYLSPRNDYSFKTLFGKKHKNLTLSFLNAILGKTGNDEIIELIFQETEQIPELRGDRRSFLDIYCTDAAGKHFIIEMQNDPQDFFFERMIYYASLIFSRQRPRPFLYEQLTPVIFIGILSTQLNSNHPDVISEHAIMNTKHNTVSSRYMMYYLVELGKFNKTEDELETDTDKWLFFMKNADEYRNIPAVLQNDNNFQEAFHILEHIAYSEVDLFSYLAAQDAAAKLASAKKEEAKRAEEAEARAQEAQVRIHEAEAQIQQAQLRIRETETQIQEVEIRAQQAQAQIQETEIRAQQAQAQIQEAEIRAQQAQAQIQEAEIRAQQAQAQIQEAEIRAQQAQAQIQEAEIKAQEAQAQIQEAEIKAQEAQVRIREAEAQTQQAQTRAKEENAEKLLQMTNLAHEVIAITTGLSVDRVHELAKNLANK